MKVAILLFLAASTVHAPRRHVVVGTHEIAMLTIVATQDWQDTLSRCLGPI